MFDEIDKAAEALGDPKGTWVARRDAADLLGDAAGRALTALNLHFRDTDTDVRDAVAKALAKAGVKDDSPSKQFSLDELAKACAKPGVRTVEKHEKGYVVRAMLPSGRHQTVYIAPFTRKDGERLIRVYTYCGKPTPESLDWTLRANTKLSGAAFGLTGEGNEEQLVLVSCHNEKTARPEEIVAAVNDIATHGDWLEQKLTGLDEL